MKLFEYVIIDRAGEEPAVVEPGVQVIFAADAGTAKLEIEKIHVSFDYSQVEIKVREF
jgi:hypothetical protein